MNVTRHPQKCCQCGKYLAKGAKVCSQCGAGFIPVNRGELAPLRLDTLQPWVEMFVSGYRFGPQPTLVRFERRHWFRAHNDDLTVVTDFLQLIERQLPRYKAYLMQQLARERADLNRWRERLDTPSQIDIYKGRERGEFAELACGLIFISGAGRQSIDLRIDLTGDIMECIPYNVTARHINGMLLDNFD